MWATDRLAALLVLLVAFSAGAQEYNVEFRPHLAATTPIAFDAASHAEDLTLGTLTWTHTPVGTPRGVIVFCIADEANTDDMTGATYGGVAMTQVANAIDTAGEMGLTEAYFLGSSIPTGAQTVECVDSVGWLKWGQAFTFTAGGDTSLAGAGSCAVSNNTANPSCSIGSQTTPTMAAAAIFSGENSESAITAGSGFTKRGVDSGFVGTSMVGQTMTTEQASGTVTAGFTVISNDVAMVAVAIKQ